MKNNTFPKEKNKEITKISLILKLIKRKLLKKTFSFR